ncbi:MAG: hypothetical protein JWQ79_1977 [Mucilaginibacter sp.]|nr:hypothetical protein [Mucilaginibacter sp.]
MKKIIHIITVCLLCSIAGGCIKDDNAAAPNAAVNGTLTDASTRQPFQSEPNEERLYVLQTSYTAGTPIPFYWNIQPDGTYNNSEVFAGTYKIYPTDGAFVPLVYTSNGTLVDNGSKVIQVNAKQTTTQNFTVTPFLTVAWVGDPVLNSDGTVSISCTVTRGTTDPTWQFNLTDVFFFVSNTSFVSSASYDNTLSTDVTYANTLGNAFLGTTITIKSKAALGLHQGYYLRVGARTADNVNKRYNYTTVKTIAIP